MASVFQNQTTKKWEFVFDRYVNGKRKQVRRRGFKTKREANEQMTNLQKEAQDGEYVEPSSQTMREFFKYWIENVRKLECESTHYYNNTLYLKNHINPRLGDIKLQELTPEICQQFVKDMHDDSYSRNTIDRVCTMIKLALDSAVAYKYIKQNNMRKVKLPREQKKEMKIWTLHQVTEFLKFTKGKRFYCLYAIALLTGMRQGEILGLRWKDIDFEKKTIVVNQTLTHYGKSLTKGAKTIAGERTISISDALVSILKKQKHDYNEFRLRSKEFVDQDLVIFNLKNGGTVFPSNLTKTYISTVKKSGLPHIPFHSLRHTHATILIQQNVNVKVISERLGHSKVGITLDIYSHVLPSMQEEVANKLDEIINL